MQEEPTGVIGCVREIQHGGTGLFSERQTLRSGNPPNFTYLLPRSRTYFCRSGVSFQKKPLVLRLSLTSKEFIVSRSRYPMIYGSNLRRNFLETPDRNFSWYTKPFSDVESSRFRLILVFQEHPRVLYPRSLCRCSRGTLKTYNGITFFPRNGYTNSWNSTPYLHLREPLGI